MCGKQFGALKKNMAPVVVWLKGKTADEVAQYWDGHHIVSDNTLFIYRCGAPYDDRRKTRHDVYVTELVADDDLERQIALTVPAPECAVWRPFARITPAVGADWDADSNFSYVIVTEGGKKI